MKKHLPLFFIVSLSFFLGYTARQYRVFPLNQWWKRNVLGEIARMPPRKLPPRFIDTSTKKMVGCPSPQNALFILALGQSNAANYIQEGHERSVTRGVLNWYQGNCYEANAPLLGSSGEKGNLWLSLGKQLQQATKKTVVIVTYAIGSTSMDEWRKEGDVGKIFLSELQTIRKYISHFDFIFWMQGESDKGRESQYYVDNLKNLFSEILQLYPKAKIGLSSTTYCNAAFDFNLGEFQKRLALSGPSLFWLGDTDEFYSNKYRSDQCHLNSEGAEKVAAMFFSNILKSSGGTQTLGAPTQNQPNRSSP